MPVLDGIEATKQIRSLEGEDGRQIPILAMTANAFEEDRKKAYDAGMSGYLIKPLDINTLLSELKNLLMK